MNEFDGKWFIYIVECEDNSLYVGVTKSIKRRFREHQSGKGSKFVKSRRALKIVYSEEFDNKYDAFRREREIKGFSRQKKLKIIKCSSTIGTPLLRTECSARSVALALRGSARRPRPERLGPKASP